MQLLTLEFMAARERERVRKDEKRQSQQARASRGVALAIDQGSALGVHVEGEDLDQYIKSLELTWLRRNIRRVGSVRWGGAWKSL